MLLPELGCKEDPMPMSVVWVLFESKYKRKREREEEGYSLSVSLFMQFFL